MQERFSVTSDNRVFDNDAQRNVDGPFEANEEGRAAAEARARKRNISSAPLNEDEKAAFAATAAPPPTPAEQDDGLDSLPFRSIQQRAREAGLRAVGVSRADLIAQLRAL